MSATLAQIALAEGLTTLIEVHGSTWTFGAALFAGVASQLRPNDPRLLGSADRLFEIRALMSALPSPAPERGNEISRDGTPYRIARVDYDLSTQIATILVSVP